MPTHYIGDEATRRALDAFIKLSRARKTMGDRTNRLLAEYGLSESQFGTLEALYHLGPMYQSQIGEKLLVTGGNMTMVINNLEKRELICRGRATEDRRQMTVSLSDKGHQLINELFPLHAQNILNLMSVLSADQLDQLGQMCKMLGKQDRDEPSSGTG